MVETVTMTDRHGVEIFAGDAVNFVGPDPDVVHGVSATVLNVLLPRTTISSWPRTTIGSVVEDVRALQRIAALVAGCRERA
jgi:hypothetical protein